MLEIRRVGGQHDAMGFELLVAVDVDGAIDIVLFLDERVEDFDQVGFVVVPAQTIRLAFAGEGAIAGRHRRRRGG